MSVILNATTSNGMTMTPDNSGAVQFQSNGTNTIYIDTSGNFLVGTTSTLFGAKLSVVQPASSTWNTFLQGTNGYGVLGITNTSGTSSYQAVNFYNNGLSASLCGQITVSGTSTAYNTSSDYRLKTNVTPLTTAQSGPIIDALKPSQFTWTNDNTPDVGFIAHEMQAVIPRAVTGEKDAVDAEGKPVYQQVAVSSPEIIAYLVAELQSVRQRLAGLESTVSTQATEIAALKSKVGA